MPMQSSLVPVSLPLVPRAGPSSRPKSQLPRATSVLQLLTTHSLTFRIPPLSVSDSEGPDVAQDILHFHALVRETGIDSIAGAPVRGHHDTLRELA